MAVESFNPYSIEGHYGLDLACRLVHGKRPRDVAIYADDPEVTLAAIRRLGWVPGSVRVQDAAHVAAVERALGVDVQVVNGTSGADAAIVAYSWDRLLSPPDAGYLVVVSRNRFSYRMISGRQLSGPSYRGARAWLQQTHRLQFSEGMFAPGFLGLWGSSLLAGDRKSDWHFRLGQLAMDRLYARSVLRNVASVTVLAGERREAA